MTSGNGTPSSDGAPSTCSACQLGAVVGGVCDRCGAAFGEAQRCPHCHVVARAEPKISEGKTSWVCSACGGPRVPSGYGGRATQRALVEAKAWSGKAVREQAGRLLFFVMAAFTTLVLIAAWPQALTAKLVLLAFAALPAALALRAHGRTRKATRAADQALERAWLRAAEEVAATSRTGVTAEELADQLHIDPRRADALLTDLAVHDRTRIEVGDDAEVRYSVSPETMSNVRLDLSDGDDDDQVIDLESPSTSARGTR